MTKRFYKHKLLLDENFPVRSYFPNLNKRHDVKHLTKDLNMASISDAKVYKFAQKAQRIIVTYNIKDFLPLIKDDIRAGVIGISPNLPPEEVDKKLTAFLNRATKKSLLGKITKIGGETEVE